MLMQGITFWNSINNFTVEGAYTYNNIFSVIGSISLFLAFSKFNFKSNLINAISKHTLAIYIIHVNEFIRIYIWRTLLKSNEYYTSNKLIYNWIASILTVFVSGLIIDILREVIVKCTIAKILKNNKIYNYEFTIEGNIDNE